MACGGETSYDLIKAHHDRAYAVVNEALDMDENGDGDKETVIDLYSQGVAEFEKGVSIIVDPSDHNAKRAEKLRVKMQHNLEMARGRVQDLLEGKELKGSETNLSPDSFPSFSSSILPSSLPAPPSGQPHKVPLAKPTTTGPNPLSMKPKVKSNPYVPSSSKRKEVPDRGRGREREARERASGIRPGGVPNKKSSSTSSNSKNSTVEVKGIDPSLVEIIMNEIQDKDTNISWNDIVGLENAKKSLQEIVVLPALNPELFVGLRTPAKGLLLFGPPGNGKTMIAKAVAHESKSTFFSMSASSLTSKYVGEGEKLVKAMFAVARQLQPSIIFIDELDSLLSKRGEGEHDSTRRLKNEFLLQFDGVGTTDCERLLVMGATNRPDEIDDAALRRFTKRIYIPLPDMEARLNVLVKLLSNHRHNLTIQQLTSIAMHTQHYSFSDLTALARDAALGPIRDLNMESVKSIRPDQVSPITYTDFQHSLTQVRSSVTLHAIQSLEQWNTLYGMGQ